MPRLKAISNRRKETFSQFVKARDILKHPVAKILKITHVCWDPTLHLTNFFFQGDLVRFPDTHML